MLSNPSTLSFSKPRGFLVIDGVNGSGKGTLITKISEKLTSNGFGFRTTREPGGTELGKTVRQLVLSSPQLKLTPVTEVLLFSADRAQHISEVVLASTEAGTLVISDRFHYSTVAFQGFGRGLDVKMLKTVSEIATSGVRPDVVLLLDLDPKEGLIRAQARNTGKTSELDVLEHEEIAFHQRVREGFLSQARELSEPFVVLDASQSAEKVFAQAWLVVERWAKAFLAGK